MLYYLGIQVLLRWVDEAHDLLRMYIVYRERRCFGFGLQLSVMRHVSRGASGGYLSVEDSVHYLACARAYHSKPSGTMYSGIWMML